MSPVYNITRHGCLLQAEVEVRKWRAEEEEEKEKVRERWSSQMPDLGRKSGGQRGGT